MPPPRSKVKGDKNSGDQPIMLGAKGEKNAHVTVHFVVWPLGTTETAALKIQKMLRD